MASQLKPGLFQLVPLSSVPFLDQFYQFGFMSKSGGYWEMIIPTNKLYNLRYHLTK